MAAIVLSALTATPARAACFSTQNASPAAYQSAVQSFQRMQSTRQARPAATQRDQAPADAAPSIVGLWHTVFLADPNGGYYTAGPNVFDEGFDAWHADGTETLNDISPPPTGNVCIGAWTQTGPSTYFLKHPTWGYDPADNATIIGVGTISEQITLDPSGNSYSGTVTFDALDLTGASVFHGTATIMAERINPDSKPFAPTPGPPMTTKAVVSPATLTTSQASVVLDGSGSTGTGPLTYFYSVVAGGKVPAILQSPNNPKATIDFVNGPGTYMIQLKVTDSVGHTAVSDPIMLVYKPM